MQVMVGNWQRVANKEATLTDSVVVSELQATVKKCPNNPTEYPTGAYQAPIRGEDKEPKTMAPLRGQIEGKLIKRMAAPVVDFSPIA